MKSPQKNTFSWKSKKILITGGAGFVGSHVVEYLILHRGVKKSQIAIPRSKTNDLRDLSHVVSLVKKADIVLHLASDVGGIAYSSTHQATQLRNCLLMDLNMFEAASRYKPDSFVCLSSAVAYPQHAVSPLKEDDIFNGFPAPGGYGYGIGKRMTVAFSKAYFDEKGVKANVLLSTNAYGPGDDFDLENGHVIPSLIRKCLEQNTLEVWGDGSVIRDFIYVKDLARAVVLAAESPWSKEPINIGSGKKVSIKKLVETVVKITKFHGKVYFDSSKPTGQKTRVLSTKRAKELLSFTPEYSLTKGIKETVEWYKGSKKVHVK